MKKYLKGLLVLSCGLFLVACGKEPMPEVKPFDFDSSVKTRAKTEINNSNSYVNTNYYGEYSFGVTPETFIQIIRDRYREVIQFTSSPFEKLEFKKVDGAPTFSESAENHTYLVNDLLLINFVVPKLNGIEWDDTVSNIQIFFPYKEKKEGEGDTIQEFLFNLIVLSIVQETKSATSVITTSGDYLSEGRGYGTTGGHYSLDKDSKEIQDPYKDFFKSFFQLKNKDRIHAYNFTRY